MAKLHFHLILTRKTNFASINNLVPFRSKGKCKSLQMKVAAVLELLDSLSVPQLKKSSIRDVIAHYAIRLDPPVDHMGELGARGSYF